MQKLRAVIGAGPNGPRPKRARAQLDGAYWAFIVSESNSKSFAPDPYEALLQILRLCHISLDFASAQLGATRLGSARLARLVSARLGPARVSSTRLAARLGLAWLGSAWLGWARPGPARLSKAPACARTVPNGDQIRFTHPPCLHLIEIGFVISETHSRAFSNRCKPVRTRFVSVRQLVENGATGAKVFLEAPLRASSHRCRRCELGARRCEVGFCRCGSSLTTVRPVRNRVGCARCGTRIAFVTVLAIGAVHRSAMKPAS